MSHEQGDRGERHYETIGDPILGNSALDRLAHGAYQIVIEGPSYRAKKAPRVLDTK